MIWIHVSELAIDRLLAGEVAPADAAAMRDHAASCARCGAMLDDALCVQYTFAAARPPLALPIPLRRRAVVIAPVLALAAAALLVLAWPRNAPPVIRVKGSAIIGCVVDTAPPGTDVIVESYVHTCEPEQRVQPGNRIMLTTTTVEHAWFAAVSVDARGVKSVYADLTWLDPTHDVSLPFAIELDDVLGREVVTGVFCAQRFIPLAIDLQNPPAGCSVDHFALVKVPR